MKKYHIKHSRISSYNLRTNGIVKWSHFNVQQVLYKAADSEQNCWAQVTHSVFWAERVTPQRHMGCSPYYAAMGTHPLLPFNIIEANYLLPPPDLLLSSTNLIMRQAVALQKCTEDLAALHNCVHTACNRAAVHFEWEHGPTICNFDFKHSDLILV